jgi:hypothetical protein
VPRRRQPLERPLPHHLAGRCVLVPVVVRREVGHVVVLVGRGRLADRPRRGLRRAVVAGQHAQGASSRGTAVASDPFTLADVVPDHRAVLAGEPAGDPPAVLVVGHALADASRPLRPGKPPSAGPPGSPAPPRPPGPPGPPGPSGIEPGARDDRPRRRRRAARPGRAHGIASARLARSRAGCPVVRGRGGRVRRTTQTSRGPGCVIALLSHASRGTCTRSPGGAGPWGSLRRRPRPRTRGSCSC